MSIMEKREKACLLLADGSVFEGYSFGAKGESIGEVVFNTGMTGYQELLTDTSYYGQIVAQTYPLIGNYGINFEDNESRNLWVKGYIVREWCEQPSNFRSRKNIDAYLKENNIIGLYGIDTRRLTRLLRNKGTMNGMITTGSLENKEELLEKIKAYKICGAVEQVSTKIGYLQKEAGAKYNVTILDFGFKKSVLDNLNQRMCNVTILPALSTAEDILAGNPDGIMLSDGPGDPEDNPQIIQTIAKLCKSGVPIFGIGLSHQMLALANGFKTVKLLHGHRGANQPVKELASGKILITTQNHGYEVDGVSVDPQTAEIFLKNINDGSCEGLRYKAFPAQSIQFEIQPAFFDSFIQMMQQKKEEM